MKSSLFSFEIDHQWFNKWILCGYFTRIVMNEVMNEVLHGRLFLGHWLQPTRLLIWSLGNTGKENKL